MASRPLVYPANFTFKALKLPAGKSSIAFEYDPYPIKWGWIAYYLCFIGFLAGGSIGSTLGPERIGQYASATP